MKRLVAGALLGCFALFVSAHAATNDVLVVLKARLEVVMTALDPKPDIWINPDHAVTFLRAIYLPQTNKVHRILNKKGDLSANVDDEIGPSPKGFILYVRSEPKGSPNQLVHPQILKGPCSQTYVQVTPVADSDKQLDWRLLYGSQTDTNLLSKVKEVIEDMKHKPNQVPEDTARKFADPQH
ncbi:MAG: hypothetical protein NT011_05825 [Kiritimatiellaeota bacterium]|nr:hypothetical protein [Kiritimatiellota bacterium]